MRRTIERGLLEVTTDQHHPDRETIAHAAGHRDGGVAGGIGNGHVRLDIAGSSPQRPGPLNCSRAMAKTAIAFVTRCLVDDRIPVNEGFLRRLHVDGPDGTCCTAVRPAAVVGGWELNQRLTEVIFLALHPALPARVPAAGKGIVVNIGFGGQDPKRGEYYCYMETVAGGNGARPTKDGPDAVQTNLQNTENAPIEEVELNYPIRVARLELIPDSGGAGTFRGGLGVRRDFEFPDAPCTWSVMSDGRKFAPWGLAGGRPGRPARFILDPLGEHKELPSQVGGRGAEGRPCASGDSGRRRLRRSEPARSPGAPARPARWQDHRSGCVSRRIRVITARRRDRG